LFNELLVRRPLFHALEKQLRSAVRDDDTRFRIAGELLLYTEKSPQRTSEEHTQFRAELETTLGKVDSGTIISLAHTLHKGYRFTLAALKVLWLILFLAGTWGLGRIFIGWDWNAWTSLLVAAFVSGATLELVKWLLVWRIA
jgi:hypothetical protein